MMGRREGGQGQFFWCLSATASAHLLAHTEKLQEEVKAKKGETKGLKPSTAGRRPGLD